MVGPVRRDRDRPRAQPVRRPLAPGPVAQAGPPPVRRPADQPGPERVPLDVPQDRVQVVVLLDGERLEPPLVQVAGPGRVVVGVPPHGMRVRQPPEKVRHVPVGNRPEDEVPVVGHQTVREDSDRMKGPGLVHDPEEGVVIRVLLEEREAGDSPVQGVVHVPARRLTACAWHRTATVPPRPGGVNGKMSRVPFSLPPFPFRSLLFSVIHFPDLARARRFRDCNVRGVSLESD
jgi:hypothetical protein